MRLTQRILVTALAFWVDVLLMPLAPFAMAWLFCGESKKSEDRE